MPDKLSAKPTFLIGRHSPNVGSAALRLDPTYNGQVQVVITRFGTVNPTLLEIGHGPGGTEASGR